MKKFFGVIAFLSLVGCKDFTSAKGVIGTAADAVKKGNYDLYLETLTGDAATNYGNVQAFNNFKTQITSYQKMDVANVALTSRNGDMSYYSAEVVGAGQGSLSHVANVNDDCQARTYHHTGTCEDRCWHTVYDGSLYCEPGCEPGYDYQEDYCLISKISH